jgi:hypothetical protein
MRRKWEEGSRGKERRGEREGKKGQSKEIGGRKNGKEEREKKRKADNEKSKK